MKSLTVAAAFTLALTSSQAQNIAAIFKPQPVPKTGWWTTPGFLPAQVDPSRLSIRAEKVPRFGYTETRCVINDRISISSSEGVILDNQSVYTFNDRSPCQLFPVLTIQPRHPETAAELVAEIGRNSRQASNALKGVNPLDLGERYKVQGVRGLGVKVGEVELLDLKLNIGLAPLRKEMHKEALEDPAEGWWLDQPGVVYPTPQGDVQAIGKDSGFCFAQVADKVIRFIEPSSIMITDAKRAFYVDSNCRVEPMVIMPNSRDDQGRGAGLRNPGNIPLPKDSKAQPATSAAVPAVAVGVVGGLIILGMESEKLNQAQQHDTVLLLKEGAAEAWARFKKYGLSAETFGKKAANGEISKGAETGDPNLGDFCRKEWYAATKLCEEQLAKPNPDFGITGRYTTVSDCARGLVKEKCRGNKIDWGRLGPPEGWSPK